jgi:5,6,7,8-tetrahydromethanopterin hydro-lyase
LAEGGFGPVAGKCRELSSSLPLFARGDTAMSMFVGEALTGEGNEIAHIDLLIGNKEGPVGVAFANALARQSEGHSNLLAVLTPNLAVKPSTVLITKVTIKGAKQAVQMFGPAQAAVAKAVADSVEAGVIPKKDVEDLVIVCGVFIHWDAADDKKIYEFNYKATKDAIAAAMKSKPSVDEMLAGKESAHHPFRGF